MLSNEKYLNIVLEYIENGSLAGIVKKFNPFEEGLVSVFIEQVLQGLKYLHAQGLVHRDIKGANLLTTKDGTVKLADFGVAMKLTESIKSMSIVGTPYWMAPEIVEQSGRCTTSCDIWSVGCTVIELLTGKPPYFELEPMSALYRIVQDEYPPIPSTVSPVLKDFLIKCFQKEPFFRLSAVELLKHPWFRKADEIVEDQEMKENLYGEASKNYSESVRSSVKYSENYTVQSKYSTFSCKESEYGTEDEETTALEEILNTLDQTSSPKTLYALLELISGPNNVISKCKGVIPIIKQILDELDEGEMLHLALQITNILSVNHNLQPLVACSGLLSSSLRFIGEEYNKELRIETAFLIGSLFQAQGHTVELLLASGGIEATIKLLDPNFNENKELVIIGIDCLLSLLENSEKEYIRICASFGTIERLALTLHNISADSVYESYTEKVTDLLLIFSTSVECVIEKFCEEDVLSIIVTSIPCLNSNAKLQVMNVLKNLASHRNLQNRLENAGFVSDIVKIVKNESDDDVLLASILTLNSLCILSPARQEQAVLAGVVPVLQSFPNIPGKLFQLSTSLLCSFASASIASKSILHKSRTFEHLLKIEPMPIYVFDALASWISSDTKRCKRLLCDNHIQKLVNVFNSNEETLPGMAKIFGSDSELSQIIGLQSNFLEGLFTKLSSWKNDPGKGKSCLEILLAITSKHPKPRVLLDEKGFYPIILAILHSSRDDDLVVIEEITTTLLSIYSGKLIT